MNKLLKVLPVVMIVCMIVTSVFAVGQVPDNLDTVGTPSDAVTNVAYNIWATLRTIISILAVAAVVFAGVRYMFASADAKADIKKSMGILAIGAILVFGSTWIIDIIINLSKQVANQQ